MTEALVVGRVRHRPGTAPKALMGVGKPGVLGTAMKQGGWHDQALLKAQDPKGSRRAVTGQGRPYNFIAAQSAERSRSDSRPLRAGRWTRGSVANRPLPGAMR